MMENPGELVFKRRSWFAGDQLERRQWCAVDLE
jgi:hypothetical protein